MNDKEICDHVGTLKAVVAAPDNENLFLLIDPFDDLEGEEQIRATLKNSAKFKDVFDRLVGKEVYWIQGLEAKQLFIFLFYCQLGPGAELEPGECVFRSENGFYVRVDRR